MFITPNPNNQWEMELWTAIAAASALSRLTPTGAAFLVLAAFGLILLALGLALCEGAKRLFSLYRRHAFSTTKNARILQVAGVVLVLLWLVAYVLYRDQQAYPWGLMLFSNTLLVFVLLCEFINWRAAGQQPASGLPHNVTLQQIVSWHKTVQPQSQP